MRKGLNPSDKHLNDRRYIRVHPSWYSFIKHCGSMRFGEIENLKIQNGLPVMAEEVKTDVRFGEEITDQSYRS